MSQQLQRQLALDENIKHYNDSFIDILRYATGFGKSFQAIQMSLLDKSKRWLIVCWELNHIINWKKEFIKHKIDLSNYHFVTYTSFTKCKGNYNIIFDECHHITEKHSVHILEGRVTPSKIICLSATIPNERLLIIKHLGESKCPVGKKPYRISTRTLSASIKTGVLPEPEINIVFTELNTITKSEELIITKGGKKAVTKIECDYYTIDIHLKRRQEVILHVRCTQRQKYDYYDKQFNTYWDKFLSTREEWAKFSALQFASKRKRYLAETKTNKIKEIISSIDDRFICFCGSIDQVKNLGGKNAVSSKLSRKKVENIINDFNQKKIDKLFAVNMLREGVNLVDTPYGIIGQLDNQSKSLNQIIGRLLRHESPQIFIIVVKNTQDEKKFLPTAISDINPTYIKYVN